MPRGVYERNGNTETKKPAKKRLTPVKVVNHHNSDVSLEDFIHRATELFENAFTSSEKARALSELYRALESAEDSI